MPAVNNTPEASDMARFSEIQYISELLQMPRFVAVKLFLIQLVQ